MKSRHGLKVLVLYTFLATFACGAALFAILKLNARAAHCRSTALAAQEVEHRIDDVSRLELEAYGPEMEGRDLQGESARSIQSLELAATKLSMYRNSPLIGNLVASTRAYDRILSREFSRLDVRDLTGARQIDFAEADPAYDNLREQVARTTLGLENRAERARHLADVLSPIFLVSSVLLALVCALGQQRAQVKGLRREQQARTAEESARKVFGTHERLTAVLADLKVAVWTASADGTRIDYVSPGLAEIYGRPAEDFYQDPNLWRQVIHPADTNKAVEEVASGLTSAGTATSEYRIVRPDGEVRWISCFVKIARDHSGAPTRLNGSTTDVTAERQASLALKASQQRYDRTVENVPGVVYQFRLAPDGTKSFPYMSPQSLAYFGVPAEEIMADPMALIGRINAEDMAGHDEVLRASIEDMSVSNWECRITTKAGEERYFRRNSKPEQSSDGSITWDAIMFDVTAQKQAEQSEREVEAARRANLAKSHFLSRMSHELRTPMNAILGFAQVLGMDSLEERQQVPVDQIIKAGRHLLNLINEVLEISRIESGTLAMSIEPVNVREVVSNAIDMVSSIAVSSGITIEAVWDHDPAIQVSADMQRLAQSIINLLSNAIKYNRQGGLVTVRSSSKDGKWVLDVEDTGLGIPSTIQARLFSPFDRLGAEQTETEGTGLGLSLTKNMVDAMGGSVRLVASSTAGSVFRVELPTVEGLSSVPALSDPAPGLAQAESQVTVLYIEDNGSNRLLMETLFAKKPGFRLDVAETGAHGLELAAAQTPDIILLDLHLPDMDGRTVLQRLRTEPQSEHTPVIVLSADANPGQIQRLLDTGANEYLTKPIDVGAFWKAMNGVTALKERHAA